MEFFNLPNPSSRTMVLGSTQPLTEKSIRNIPGGKGRPARKADKFTAICEPIVWIERWSLTVSQVYGPPRPLTGMALPLPLPLHGQIARYGLVWNENTNIYTYL
jgi:hypothetical protein